MLYPSIDKILTKIDSKYALVHIASARSKELAEKNDYLLEKYDSVKNIGKAMEEIANEKIIIK